MPEEKIIDYVKEDKKKEFADLYGGNKVYISVQKYKIEQRNKYILELYNTKYKDSEIKKTKIYKLICNEIKNVDYKANIRTIRELVNG